MATLDLFNESFYLAMNPDVRAAVERGDIDARSHFNQWGRAEARAASPLFNPADYLAQNPDVKEAVELGLITAYDHFQNYGIKEGRAPFSGFDVGHYLDQNPDVAAAVDEGRTTVTEHFLLFGLNEIRNFNPEIDLQAYLDANADVAAAFAAGQISLAQHFIQDVIFNLPDIDWGAVDPDPSGEVPDWGDFFDIFGQVDWAAIEQDAALAQAYADGNLALAYQRLIELIPNWNSIFETTDWDSIWANLEGLNQFLPGWLGSGFMQQLFDLQNTILQSGLLDPANLNPDGSGLLDPSDLVDLIWNEFYGVSPYDLIGNMPMPPDLMG